ncbi:S8 family peptidase [Pontiellaceae bacterium B1224]|nr:S8 family peptidase [Pontiellaceae bacterium B1224]
MEKNLPHIVLQGPNDSRGYTSPQSGGGPKFSKPARNRASHAQYIAHRLDVAWAETETGLVAGHTERDGIYLEFRGQAGYDLATESLESIGRKNIRLCNIRTEEEQVLGENGQTKPASVICATVYVPNDQRQYFANKVEAYATGENPKSIKRDKIFPLYDAYKPQITEIVVNIDAKDKLKLKPEILNIHIEALSTSGVPNELIELLKKTPKNAKLVEGIEDVRKAIARSFWVDKSALFPRDDREWCEVWLRSSSDNDTEQEFIALANTLELPLKGGRICFPERIVKLVHINGRELEILLNSCEWIAEFRRAKETADLWIEQPPREQAGWVENLVSRMEVDTESLVSICILDHGINNGHPLLSAVLNDVDKHTVNPVWGTDDHHHFGHGTLMAGLATFGDLQSALEGAGPVVISHVLESAKILPPPPETNPKELWGDMTSQGVSRAEIKAPDRKRVVCMAITAIDGRDQGRPSSWSGAIDQLAAGVDDDPRRLFILSAGNYTCNLQDLKNYPTVQITDAVHDPAQAWNALSIGAFTNLTQITNPTLNGYEPIASAGELSPFSTTSFDWDKAWPIKPEIVFEGGNAAMETSSGFVTECDDLSLISTGHQPHHSLFQPFSMTSAATAQAACFAAKIQAQYPNYWPETIRALMVHSAEWTEGMKKQFPEDSPNHKISQLLKACGYGVPCLDKALFCASNMLTLISQATLQPYIQTGGKDPKTNDMHFYELPWPTSVLQEMGEITVRMRITLSYFIEPGPGEIGWKDRYRYPSHLLRFDVNSPGESQKEFLSRINAALRDEENGHPRTPSASGHWLIGSNNRDKGSIHSDIWEGTAADLAASNLIAISPRIGWWNKRKHLNKANSQTRYALIVSIETPEQDIDIYTPVAVQTGITIPVEITI